MNVGIGLFLLAFVPSPLWQRLRRQRQILSTAIISQHICTIANFLSLSGYGAPLNCAASVPRQSKERSSPTWTSHRHLHQECPPLQPSAAFRVSLTSCHLRCIKILIATFYRLGNFTPSLLSLPPLAEHCAPSTQPSRVLLTAVTSYSTSGPNKRLPISNCRSPPSRNPAIRLHERRLRYSIAVFVTRRLP